MDWILCSIDNFIWYSSCLQKLLADAEEHIKATDPPLFLRFINLLMNDAIFLLDEALCMFYKMATILEEHTPYLNYTPTYRARLR